MAEKKKKSKVFEYLRYEDTLAPGVTSCAGCPLELMLRFVPRVLGNDIMLVSTACCAGPVLFGMNVGAWHRMACHPGLMTGVPSSATGITRYYRKMGKEITVVCITGDGCAADVGFQPLSGAAERNEKFIYICYDNEGYMNTGGQKSSTTPFGARTNTTPVGSVERGKGYKAKYLPLIIAMHGVSYVATASMSHLEDFAEKLLKAKRKKEDGFAYLHVYCPCPTGWGTPTDSAIQLSRTAVRTNYFPLWEAEEGRYRFTHKVENPKPVKELVRMMGKFKHMSEEEIIRLQRHVDERNSIIKGMVQNSPLEKLS
jgi:pyruvate/2-oxoacid:ferredoxin oxidoreductase beta subunit